MLSPSLNKGVLRTVGTTAALTRPGEENDRAPWGDFEIEDLGPAFHLRAIFPRLALGVPMVGGSGRHGDLRTLFRGIRKEKAGFRENLDTVVRKTFDVRRALLVESGRSAIKLALMASGLREGDGVILPAYVCASVLQPVLELRLRPILADVRHDLQVDPESVRRVSRLGAKALLVAHLFGGLADMGRLLELSREHGFFVIDDAAQAAGLQFEARYLGTLGNAGVISFGPFKPLFGTGGGAFLTDDDQLYEAAVSCLQSERRRQAAASIWARHGIKFGLRSYSYVPFLMSRWLRSNGRRQSVPAGDSRIVVNGMNPAHGPAARERLYELSEHWKRLQGEAERFRRAVEACGWLENVLPRPFVGFPRWPLRLSYNIGRKNYREVFGSFLARGVEVHTGYVPLSRVLKRAGMKPLGEYTNAEAVYKRIFLFPFHGRLRAERFLRLD